MIILSFLKSIATIQSGKGKKRPKKLLSVFLLGMMWIANLYNFADWNGTYSMLKTNPLETKMNAVPPQFSI